MKIAFTLQSTNPFKHADMPDNAPFTVYEIADERQSEFETQGYNVLTPAEFSTYQASIDYSDYNAAVAIPVQVVINNAVTSAAAKGKEWADQFKTENILMGISAVENIATLVAVTKKLHWVEHFLLAGSLRGAIYELDTLIGSDLSGLSPFITVDRLTTYKHYIQDYLGISHT